MFFNPQVTMQMTVVMGSNTSPFHPKTSVVFLDLPPRQMCSHSRRGGKHKLSTPGNTSLPASSPDSQPCLPDLPCKDINGFLALKALKLDGKSYNSFDSYWETEAQAREFPIGVSSETLHRELFYLIAWLSSRAVCTSLCDVQVRTHAIYLCFSSLFL